MKIKQLKKAKKKGSLPKGGRLQRDLAALFNEAVYYHQMGSLMEAERRYRLFLARVPDHFEGWNNLGVILHMRGNIAEAVHCYSRTLQRRPDHQQALINLGAALKDLGRLEEAARYLRKALSINPDNTDALNILGIVLKMQGNLAEAAVCHERGLAIRPDDPEVLNNLAVIRREEFQLAEAEELLRKALAIHPRHVEALNNLAITLKEQNRPFEALEAARQALEIMPSFGEAYNIKAATLIDLCRLDDAIFSFRKHLELKPGNPKPLSAMIFTLNYQPGLDQKQIFQESSTWDKLHGAPDAAPFVFEPGRRKEGERLRIGYVSPDFRVHAVSFFFLPLLKAHHRDGFEIFCYSETPYPDHITDTMRTLADGWRDTFGVGDNEVAAQIHADRIDILVDLAGHSGRNRLPVFARKPAPVQVTWLGYPNTTGLRAIDYRFSDIVADPEGGDDPYYSEKIIRLPRSFFCYEAPTEAGEIGPLPAERKGYVTFASMNNLLKVNERVVDVWADIMTRLPDSLLCFVAKPFAHQPIRDRFLKLFADRGVAAERITMYDFLKLEEYFALHNEIDISLDTWPHNGHTVTCHALWMGVPVVTLKGNRHATRMGASVMTQIGLPELIAEDTSEYVQKAVSLGSDPARMRELRAGMRERLLRSPMCDTDGFAADIEEVYRMIFASHEAGNR